MLDGFNLDPYTVLGLTRGATFQEVREAYRLKSKKHHPDHGGDEWAFRIVVRAYESLAESREARRVPPARPSPTSTSYSSQDTGQVRQGVHDHGLDPSRIVAVEILWMRYEVEDVIELLSQGPNQRSLSGSLHLTWPDEEQAGLLPVIPDALLVLRDLHAAFDHLRAKTKVQASHLTVREGRFEAWLSYPSGSIAWEAFRTLHILLRMRGLGVRQWTRDLAIPRDIA
jgi:hypothetical protein